jgi:ATP-binding cassette subfamily B protein
MGDVNNFAQENLSGIKIVKSFANEKLEIARFGKENARFYGSLRQIYKHEAFHFEPLQYFFLPLITIFIIVAGGIWIAAGELALSDLLIFILYAAYLTAPIPSLAFMVEQVQDGLIGFERFREIMDIDLVGDVSDGENAAHLDFVKGDVCFNNVAFRYNDGSEFVLNQINLEVAAGESVAIVGPSGIGKTTLCSLIPRFYDVTEGCIAIDGKDIRDIALESLRSHIGVVRQETFLFAGTVLENILYGKPEASEQDAVEAAKKANAHDFIMSLPDGYQTDIGQRGTKLSGGQQQRISIARVFLKNPPILIFDEATSSLDYESERIVMESLTALSKGRTTFIIAHRLSTIQNADRVIALDRDGLFERDVQEQFYKSWGI